MIKHFVRPEKITKKNGLTQYHLNAQWKGHEKDDPRRTTTEPLDSTHKHWEVKHKEH
jgi:hypothetical protein